MSLPMRGPFLYKLLSAKPASQRCIDTEGGQSMNFPLFKVHTVSLEREPVSQRCYLVLGVKPPEECFEDTVYEPLRIEITAEQYLRTFILKEQFLEKYPPQT